ncbi:DUF2325 domain-containing protein [Sorangium sp. So ce448]|jgi:hypothetical protein|uniref:DUF2325 domain-containing protein n=1 Tax=unclassified Sorangium TaxID=2621164 RepID=UPI003F5EA8EB
MRITWIGGLDRNQAQLERMALQAGHHLEFHTGNTGGRGASELRAAIERADLVIVLTDVNSHGGVLLAKKLCQKLGRAAFMARRIGASRFQQLLDALAQRESRYLATG